MARQTLLSALRTMLKARVGVSLNIAAAQDAMFNQLLADFQKWLAGRYDWPFLEARFDSNVAANGRYVDFPTNDIMAQTVTMNLERPYKAEVKWNELWSLLEYGIGTPEYNYLDSDLAGQIQDPIQRWQWRTQAKYEVWPMPATAQTIRFTGQRNVAALVADSDEADLDDELIVLGVAARVLMRSKQKDAGFVQSMFTEQLTRLRASYPGRPKGIVFGEADLSRDELRRVVPIAIAH